MQNTPDHNKFPKGKTSNKMTRLPIREIKHLSCGIKAPVFNYQVVEPSIKLIDKSDFKSLHKRKKSTDNRTGTLNLQS